MNLAQRTLSGVTWRAGAQAVAQFGHFIIDVMLMRLLLPKDYGLLAMAMVFVGFVGILSEFGFGSALVQRQNVKPVHTYTVFWIMLLISSGLVVLFVLAAPWMARFYGVPELKLIMQVLALSFVFGALRIVPHALLQKQMRFDRLAQVEVTALILSGTVAVGLAYQGWGVWSLVTQELVSQVVLVGITWHYAQWHPRLVVSRRALHELLHYSANLSGFNTINYWARNADNLLIGKFMSTASLGAYSRAYNLMLLPITQITGVLSQVMFSVLSSIQDDKPRVKRVYLRVSQVIALVVFPMMLGLLVVADHLVLTLFGEVWTDTVPVIRILCLVSIIQSLCNPVGWIYTSQGRTDWMFRWGIAGSGSLLVAILVGVALGTIEAVALAYLIGNVLLFYPCIQIPGKLIDLHFREVVAAVSAALACAVVMALVVWIIAQLLPTAWSVWVQLVICILSGMLVYGTLVSLSQLQAYLDIQTVLHHFLQKCRSITSG